MRKAVFTMSNEKIRGVPASKEPLLLSSNTTAPITAEFKEY
jgi:hypothetical protein